MILKKKQQAKHYGILFQTRLHTTRENESSAIDELEVLRGDEFNLDDRDILRDLLNLHRKLRLGE